MVGALLVRRPLSFRNVKGLLTNKAKHMFVRARTLKVLFTDKALHPVSLRRSPSFRTEPLENITPLPMNKWVPEQPSPWRKYYKRKYCYGDRV